MFGVEGVLYFNRYILDADGIDGRRVNHLRTEVTQLHRLYVREFIDRISTLNHLRVSRHETVHIRPDLQDLSVERCRDDGCGIIAAATSQIGRLVRVAVAGNESRHHGYGLAGIGIVGLEAGKRLLHQFHRQFGVQHVLALLVLRTDKVACIHAHAVLDHRSHDVRAQALTIRDDGVLRLLAQVVNEEHTVVDAPQLIEELIHTVE